VALGENNYSLPALLTRKSSLPRIGLAKIGITPAREPHIASPHRSSGFSHTEPIVGQSARRREPSSVLDFYLSRDLDNPVWREIEPIHDCCRIAVQKRKKRNAPTLQCRALRLWISADRVLLAANGVLNRIHEAEMAFLLRNACNSFESPYPI
jgi:hypothetical protein